MTILELALARISGLKKKSNKEWAGPCPRCGGDDRFVVFVDDDSWLCRGCLRAGEAVSSGDRIAFLREFEGNSCPEAHAALGLECHSHGCPVADKCRLGQGRSMPHERQSERQPLQPPPQKSSPNFSPAPANDPEDRWRRQAQALIEKAHAKLLDCPEQLAYLEQRGLPLDVVKSNILGWLPEDRFPSREAWGLPTKLREDNKPKKLLIPAGILIPFFDGEDRPHRIRIRRSNPPENSARYYQVEGSGNDIKIIGDDPRGLVVIESDLDALMVRWQCRDLDIATVPLGTCGAKPKQSAMDILQKALAILVAHDFEPRINQKTGKPENPGGQGASWWLKQYHRAKRWPVPAGKDPGEYFQDHGGDIRAWVLAGLPPAFHVKKPEAKPAPVPVAQKLPQHAKGETINGHGYAIAYRVEDVRALQRHYPDRVVFAPDEMAALKGMNKEEAELMLLAKKVYCGEIEVTNPVEPDLVDLPPESPVLNENHMQDCLFQ